MPVKLRKQLTKTAGKPRLIGLPIKNYLTTVGGSESGATVAVTLVVVLAVIAGTAVVAQRSFDGLIGSRYQGRAKDARLTAEAGTAFIISEWNRPANRGLYTGVPMNQWATTKNQCTAPSPTFDINAAEDPTLDATSFANGAEVDLPSGNDGTRRTFRLLRATFASNNRNNTFTIAASPASTSGSSPAISAANPRGFLELEVEGKVYQADNQTPLATSRIIREFIIEPKCCNRSFGGIIPNIPGLGNDSRTCPGEANRPIGDLAIVTGIGGGGGLTSSSDSNALKIRDEDDNKLELITCSRPQSATSGMCDFRSNDLRTRDGLIEYEIKPIDIPPPPLIANFRQQLCEEQGAPLSGCTILNGPGLNITSATTINGDDPNNPNCHLGAFPPGSTPAYHCIVSNISLSGNNQNLTVNTTTAPVYLYLQDGNKNISVGGQGAIVHTNTNTPGSNASLEQTNLFQIRGIATDSNSSCSASQTFDLTGNASTAMFIWAPCALTNMAGTTNFGGIIWTNNLNFSGGGNGVISIAVPSNPGTCQPGSAEVPCKVLEDVGADPFGSAPIDWSARSINFTRFF
jgi:hypothetical protein